MHPLHPRLTRASEPLRGSMRSLPSDRFAGALADVCVRRSCRIHLPSRTFLVRAAHQTSAIRASAHAMAGKQDKLAGRSMRKRTSRSSSPPPGAESGILRIPTVPVKQSEPVPSDKQDEPGDRAVGLRSSKRWEDASELAATTSSASARRGPPPPPSGAPDSHRSLPRITATLPAGSQQLNRTALGGRRLPDPSGRETSSQLRGR
jgi:hypothetical protein